MAKLAAEARMGALKRKLPMMAMAMGGGPPGAGALPGLGGAGGNPGPEPEGGTEGGASDGGDFWDQLDDAEDQLTQLADQAPPDVKDDLDQCVQLLQGILQKSGRGDESAEGEGAAPEPAPSEESKGKEY